MAVFTMNGARSRATQSAIAETAAAAYEAFTGKLLPFEAETGREERREGL